MLQNGYVNNNNMITISRKMSEENLLLLLAASNCQIFALHFAKRKHRKEGERMVATKRCFRGL